MYHFDFQQFQKTQGTTSNRTGMKPMKGHMLALFFTILIFAISFYVSLPIINIRTKDSAFYIIFIILVYVGLDYLFTLKYNKFSKLLTAGAVLLGAFVVVMSVFAMPIFRASQYQEQLTITEDTNFTEEYEKISMDQIPVIDLPVAKQLGDKKMGQVTSLGSQYYVSDQYTMISVKDKIYRVSPLEYRDFFKWFQNKDSGIPGYIKVNVNDPSDVELVELEDGMKYAPSAYFQQNLERHVRFAFPFDLTTDYSFELDDEGHPYWVVTTYVPEIGFYGGNDANGVIVVDPITGDMQKYGMDDVPEWVDRVQPSEFAIEQLDNWGLYVHGFVNTLFGQKDMLINTEGYNYLTIDGQTNIFTGITSVGGDRSIVGFALINLKTKDAKFFKVNGADEASAMASAEGEVQNLGYKSTFPIILNVADKPTYFVSLKDQASLVKKYGFVSLENYSVVGVGDTVAEAQTVYLQKLKQAGANISESSGGLKELTGKVTSITSAIVDGNSNYYYTIEGSDQLFISPVAQSSELVMTKTDQNVKVTYLESGSNTIVTDSFDNLDYSY